MQPAIDTPTHAPSPGQLLGRSPALQRRRAAATEREAERSTIYEWSCASEAAPVQLARFDRQIERLHHHVAAANHYVWGDPLPEGGEVDAARGADPEPAAAVQRAGGGRTTEGVREAAAEGVKGGGGSIPYLAQIQRAFGRHDVSGVKAHVGGRARDASEAIGAEAYAMGDHVAFVGAPSLHTAAHEAAHVVQQRAGVSLRGGVGEAGDAYERHADAVADLVVRGESAEALLDERAGGGGGPSAGVQRKVGGALTVDEEGGVAADFFKTWPSPRVIWPLWPIFIAPPSPNLAAVGLYGYAEASARVGFQTSTRHRGRVYGQGRGDLGVAIGGTLGKGDLSAEVYGGAALIATVSGDIRASGFDFNGALTGALFVGVKVGPCKLQWRFGSLDLLNWKGKGALEWVTANRPAEAAGERGAGEEFVQGRDLAPVQRSEEGGSASVVDASLESSEFSAGADAVAIMREISDAVGEVVEVFEAMDEAAYDAFAATGAVFGIEDPRDVRARIAREMEQTRLNHSEAGAKRQEWIAKGAHYSSANNIAACWYNRNPLLWGPWQERYEVEQAKTRELIARARAERSKAEGELTYAGVDPASAAQVGELVQEAHLDPGYLVSWGDGEDERVPGRVEAGHARAKAAYDAALERARGQRELQEMEDEGGGAAPSAAGDDAAEGAEPR